MVKNLTPKSNAHSLFAVADVLQMFTLLLFP